MYSLSTNLENIFVREITNDTCQLITGPPCKACKRGALVECDGIAGHPAKNTLCDPVMGPRMHGEKCMNQRCRLDFGKCPGHPGRIILAKPCFAPHFIKTIIAVLKLVCARCLKMPAGATGHNSCQPCSKPFDSVSFVDGLMVMKSPVMTHKMDASGISGILKQLDTDALEVASDIGSLVLTELEVLPTRYRPYLTIGSRCITGTLTTLYANVIEANKAVIKGTNPLAAIDLQKAVNCLFDASHSTTTGATSLLTSIGKKEGRIRQDLMGKRVGESARTVIVGDGDLSICEVGLPEVFASVLGYPMPVLNVKTGRKNEFGYEETHLDECRRLVRSGEGWERCIVGGNEVMRVAMSDHRHCERLASQLAVGDIVFRNLRDGDVVVLNRQPTLHRNGFIAHVVRLVPDYSVHLPHSVTQQYNADFDGDEMNVHVPQTLQAIAELHLLLALRENLIAPNERPAFGFIQNTLVSAFLLTDPGTLFTRAQACQLMMAACETRVKRRQVAETSSAIVSIGDGFRSKMLPVPVFQCKKLVNDHWVHEERWTGSQLVSCLMPPIDIETSSFVMQRGEIMCGQLSSRQLGTGRNSLLHKIFMQYNGEEFMDSLNRMAACFLTMRGFSVGLRDCIVDIRGVPTEGKGPTFIDRMNNLRSSIKAFLDERVKGDNSLLLMSDSGSKGKPLNTTQITTAVGPQYVGGRLPPLWLGSRSLPYFKPGDERAVARGVVDTGYLAGLGPAAMFFHCAATRDSLVVASMVPAETGELQRLMCECLKPLCVDYDNQVVGEGGQIVQFTYASDGLDWTGQVVEYGTPVSSTPCILTQAGRPDWSNGLERADHAARAQLVPPCGRDVDCQAAPLRALLCKR
jgi:DNA-directed RNA polymerase beta' subunit